MREVGGGIVGGPLVLGMNSLEHAGGIRIPSAGFFSLETVAGDLLGAGSLGLGHLARLEAVGGDFGTAAGDISSLVSLTTVGGAFDVEFADEIDFSLPELEAIGGDLMSSRTKNSSKCLSLRFDVSVDTCRSIRTSAR